MSAAFHQSCSDMICKWETLVSKEGSIELDVVRMKVTQRPARRLKFLFDVMRKARTICV